MAKKARKVCDTPGAYLPSGRVRVRDGLGFAVRVQVRGLRLGGRLNFKYTICHASFELF